MAHCLTKEQPVKTLLIFIFVLLATFIGCSTITEYEPFPEGEETNPPFEYMIYCIENPNSPFCKEQE
jgi:hypothetical protein